MFKSVPIWASFLVLALMSFFYSHSAIAQMLLCLDIFSLQNHSRYSTSDTSRPKTPQWTSPAHLALTNYTLVNGTFNQAITSLRVSNGKSFELFQNQTSLYSNPRTNGSMLEEQQDFSLNKMVETKYITPQEAEYFRNLGSSLHPNQIYFWEVYHEVTAKELEHNSADLRFRIMGDHVLPTRPGLIPIKTAAMWNVAGQVLDAKKGYQTLRLPWEYEEARKNYALDRDKYKYVFEWGRAAQDIPGDIAQIYAANTLLTLLQVRALGGKIEDAYIMVHSFDKVNTRLYSRMHPNTLYPANWKNLEDALFLVPLTEALKKYDVTQASERLRKIVKLSGGQLTVLEAVDILSRDVLFKRAEMNYSSPLGQQKSPVVVVDSSIFTDYATYNTLREHGLSVELAGKIQVYLSQQAPPPATSNYLGKYNNAADSLLSQFTYSHKNAIEISNLDPAMALRDPNYVLSVLYSVLQEKMLTLALLLHNLQKIPINEAYSEAANILHHKGVMIGITTHSALLLRQIKALNPKETETLPATDTNGIKISDAERAERPYLYRDAEMNFFTVEQIVEWGLKNPIQHALLRERLRRGHWTAEYLMSLPDLL